jgi:hypothetical protein
MAQWWELRQQMMAAANRGGDWGEEASDMWGSAGDDRGAGNSHDHDHARARPIGAIALGRHGRKRPKKFFQFNFPFII